MTGEKMVQSMVETRVCEMVGEMVLIMVGQMAVHRAVASVA